MQQCQRAWQSQVSTRQRWLNQQERETAEAKLRQALENEERWKESSEQQERSRLQKLQQAAREEKHKKALQEQNLKALVEERAAILEQEKTAPQGENWPSLSWSDRSESTKFKRNVVDSTVPRRDTMQLLSKRFHVVKWTSVKKHGE